MILTVKERGQFVATMRYVHERLMEILAAWVPTTPEMEAKILLGEHIWDAAQHADALGKRTAELRMPIHHKLDPHHDYLDLISDIAAVEESSQRVAAMYEVMLPGITARYRDYLRRTDALADAPTVRLLERHLADVDRMVKDARSMCDELSLPPADQAWVDALKARETAVDNIVAGADEAMAVVA